MSSVFSIGGGGGLTGSAGQIAYFDTATTAVGSDNLLWTNGSAGVASVLTVSNLDNTDAASHARIRIVSGGSSGGDPSMLFTVTGVSNFCFGIDRSAGALCLTNAATLDGTNLIRIFSGTLVASDYRFTFNNTFPNAAGAYYGAYFDNSPTAGSTPSSLYGLVQVMNSGYTGTGQVQGVYSQISTAGTGTNPAAGQANIAFNAAATATTTGINIGYRAYVQTGDVNIGGIFATNTGKSAAKMFGVIGVAQNTAGGGGTGTAGYFVSKASADITAKTDLPGISTTVLIDNHDQAISPLTVQDNGTTVFEVVDGGEIKAQVLGKGFSVKEGSNARMGQAVLVAGTVTVSTTAVTANSRIFLSDAVTGGGPGTLSIGTVNAGTDFVINSSSGSDTSTVNWIIFEPS